ncbi:hypothetical protein CK203_037087 [Vitis vinifera]|uniref:Uncharacterized protein n=1 Tax=Vitis vinifera TaxID=29760 RepID=A0A438I5Q8_VITVI|nr:hypothetical protein CK203_037087 [Vitis vinifera]
MNGLRRKKIPPLDLCWLQDNELFNVDAIRVVSSNSQEMQASSDHMVSSHSYKRKHNEVPREKDKGGFEKEEEHSDEPMETLAIDDLTGKEVKVSNCGEKTCTESINISGAKERFAEVGDGHDLEKMTLGDWFDFVELHLPKQIYDVIEEMIAGMRESGERVREHMLQQKNEKGKLAICKKNEDPAL